MTTFFKLAILFGLLFAVVSADIDIQIPGTLSTTLTAVQDHWFGALSLSSGAGTINQLTGGADFTIVSSTLEACEWDYWRVDASQWASFTIASDYLHVNISNSNTATFTASSFYLYVIHTDCADCWETLPTADNYDFRLNVDPVTTAALSDNFLEIPPCELKDTGYYWIALSGEQSGFVSAYTLSVSLRRPLGYVNNGIIGPDDAITPLTFGTPVSFVNDTRLFPGPLGSPFPSYGVSGNQADQNRIRDWHYFEVTFSPADYAPGVYFTVNVSDVTTYSQNPAVYEDDNAIDYFQLAVGYNQVPYYPLNSLTLDWDGIKSCETTICSGCTGPCITGVDSYCHGDLILASTGSLRIYPESFGYGTYYIGVRLPLAYYNEALSQQYVYFETSYTIQVDLVKPEVTTVVVGAPGDAPLVGLAPLSNYNYLDDVIAWAADYYYFSTANANGASNLVVRLSNIHDVTSTQGRALTAQLRMLDGKVGDNPDLTLPSLPIDDTCPCIDYSDTKCSSCEECSLIIPFCEIPTAAQDWFLAIYPEDIKQAPLNRGTPSSDTSAPVYYELEVYYYSDPEPEPLTAGVPVFGTLGSAEYNFWEITVPEVTDTWLFVELFVNYGGAPVNLQLLYNSTPGAACYHPGDLVCESDTSCYFYIDTCHLEAGTYYLSVYGLAPYTQYRTHTEYTLWIDFETPWQVSNNVTYSDTVRVGGYNHYYLRAENIVEGSWLTVEFDNIRDVNGLASSTIMNAYVNYENLAGECPCYASLRNCSVIPKPSSCGAETPCTEDWALDLVNWDLESSPGSSDACCKIEIDSCSFRDGLWYIAVRSEADPFESSADPQAIVGYTLTAIIHPPAPVFQLPFNHPLVDWVDPFELNHYRLVGAYAAAESNLVLTLTWMQDNCGRLASGDNYYFNEFSGYPVNQLADVGQLNLRVASGSLAQPECYEYPWSCSAETDTYSACKVVVPYCVWSQWTETTFVSVQYIPTTSQFPAQFTLRATAEVDPVIPIAPGVSYRGVVSQFRYVHYTLDVLPLIQNNYRLEINYYYNGDRNAAPSLLIQVNAPAGGQFNCPDDNCQSVLLACNYLDGYSGCYYNLDPCDIKKIGDGIWYLSIFGGETPDFFNVPSEYTLTADWTPAIIDFNVDDITQTYTVWPTYYDICDDSESYAPTLNAKDQIVYYSQQHFRVFLPELTDDDYYYQISFREIGAHVYGNGNDYYHDYAIYHNLNAQAGVCDCYFYDDYQSNSGSQDCGSTYQDYTVSNCPGENPEWLGAWNYFNFVYFDGSNPVSFQLTATKIRRYETRQFGTITNTDDNGVVFHLGVDTSLLYLYDLADDIDAWINWNSANEKPNEIANFNTQYIYYVFTVSADNQQVFYALYNIVEPDCDTTTSIDLYFSGSAAAATTDNYYCGNYNEVPLCTSVGPGADFDGSRLPCWGALDRCLTPTAGDYVVTLAPNFNLPSYVGLDYVYGPWTFTYNLKLFTQDVYTVSATQSSANQLINVTYYLGGVQVFELTGVQTTGNSPMTQIVFRDVVAPIEVYLYPAQAPGDEDVCTNCYSSSCIEVRGGFPISDTSFFDGTVTDKPQISDLLHYNFVCGDDGPDCTVSLLPCALSNTDTTWYMAVYLTDFTGVQSDGNVADNVFRFYWDNLSDRRTTNVRTITQAEIDSRERQPGPEACTNCGSGTELSDNINGLDSFFFYTWTVPESLVARNFNGTKDNSAYTQLEVQLYYTNPATAGSQPATWVAYISTGDSPLVAPNTPQTVGTAGASYQSNCCDGESHYTCFDQTCAARDQTFVVPPCCLTAETYWVTIRLLTPGEAGFQIRVREVEQKVGNSLATFVDSQDFGAGVITPSTYPSIVSGDTNEESGVEPNNYVHFYTTLFDDQISAGESLIFNLTVDDLTTAQRNGNDLYLFVRYAAPAGLSSEDAVYEDQQSCLGYTYSCLVQQQDDICVIEIPNCQLKAGDWYFSLYQDGWFADYQDGLTDPTSTAAASVDVRDPFYQNIGFELNIYFRPAAYNVGSNGNVIVLSGANEVCTNHSEGGLAPAWPTTSGYGSTIQYKLTIEEDAVNSCYGSTTSDECFSENVLVIEVWSDDLTSTTLDVALSAPNTLVVSNNQFDLADQPEASVPININQIPVNSLSDCPASLVNAESTGVNGRVFYFRLDACNTPVELRAGDYYLSITTSEYRSYSICTHIEHVQWQEFTQPYSAITPSSIDDETNSLLIGTFSYPPSTTTPINNFYFKFNIDQDQADNQLNYLQVQVTDVYDCTDNTRTSCTDPGPGALDVTLSFFENCESFSNPPFYNYAVTPSGTNPVAFGTFRETVLDESGFVLCSLRAGYYHLEIDNGNNNGFTLNVLLRQALLAAVSFDKPTYSQIWQNQYQVYSLDITETRGKIVEATLGGVNCGTVEMWSKYGSPAGPNSVDSPSNEAEDAGTYYWPSCDTCSADHCTAHDGVDCSITFNRLQGGKPEKATWYFTVHGVTQNENLFNYQIDPITYYVSFAEIGFEWNTDTTVGCDVFLTYDDQIQCVNPDPVVVPHIQFSFKHELVTLFSWVRFTVTTGKEENTVFASYGLNNTVEFDDTDSDTTSIIGDPAIRYYGHHVDDTDYYGPLAGPTQFNIWLEGPVDSSILFERFLPYVPTIIPDVTYESSLATGTTNAQYYQLTALGSEYNVLTITPTTGDICIDFVSWTDYYTQTGTPTDSDRCVSVSSGTTALFAIPTSADYFFVRGDSYTCDYPCQAIAYTFSYVNYIPHTVVDCDTFECHAVGDHRTGAYDVYDFVPQDVLSVWKQDQTFEYLGQEFIFTSQYVDYDYSVYGSFYLPNIDHPTGEDFYLPSDSNFGLDTLNTNFGSGFDFQTICPIEHLAVTSEISSCSSVYSLPEVGYSLEYQCVPYSINDITTAVLTTGFSTTLHPAGKYYYSFDLRTVDLEFKLLDVSWDNCGGEFDWYINYDLTSDNFCNVGPDCEVQSAINFFTVYSATAFSLNIQLKTIPDTVLTLGVNTDLVSVPATDIYHIFRVDVDSFAVDDYLQFEITAFGGSTDFSFDQVNLAQVSSLNRFNGLIPRCSTCYYRDTTNIDAASFATTDRSAFATVSIAVDTCGLESGSWYLWLQAPSCNEVHFSVKASLFSSQVAVLAVPTAAQSLISRWSQHEFAFYTLAAGGKAGQVRLANVLGGHLGLYLNQHHLPEVDAYGSGTTSSQYHGLGLSAYQVTDDGFFTTGTHCGCDGYYCNTLTHTPPLDAVGVNDDCVSCSILIPCDFSDNWYIGVKVLEDESTVAGIDTEIYYGEVTYLLVAGDETWTALAPTAGNAFSVVSPADVRAAFAAGNWQHFLYTFGTDTAVVSITLEIAVTGDHPGDGVWVTLAEDDCFKHPLKNVWCSAEYESWICELQIPTRAEHRGNTQFYVDVYGRQGAFSLTVVTGTDNCENPPAADLAFCADYVDYAVWSVTDFAQLDAEAACRYNNLLFPAFERKDDSCSPVCWTGISDECDDLLKRFSCYESFPPCDRQGFVRGTCTQFCEVVESTCDIAFASVGLQQYDCYSNQYLDANAWVCAGQDSDLFTFSPSDF